MTDTKNTDLVQLYACELLTLGLVWLNYYDAIKEGDGERIMRIWKYLLIAFREAGHKNYAKKGAILLIKGSNTNRFINTKGRSGYNLPCDLHLEHLNHRLKGIITRMESNVKPSFVCRAAKAIGRHMQVFRE